MCGRTTSTTSPERIAELFDAVPAAGLDLALPPRYNVGPTAPVLGLSMARPGRDRPDGDPATGERADPAGLILDGYRWGLIPSWSKDQKTGNRMFNARAETVAEKPAFRKAFASRRLIVVADGFYEWRRDPDGGRQPFYFRRNDGYPLTFAGLWEPWRDPATGTWLQSCTIITTRAGGDMDGVHDRMPVVVERDRLAHWLRPGAPAGDLLVPAPAGTLLRHSVDRRVGNVRNDDPGLVAPVDGAP